MHAQLCVTKYELKFGITGWKRLAVTANRTCEIAMTLAIAGATNGATTVNVTLILAAPPSKPITKNPTAQLTLKHVNL